MKINALYIPSRLLSVVRCCHTVVKLQYRHNHGGNEFHQGSQPAIQVKTLFGVFQISSCVVLREWNIILECRNCCKDLCTYRETGPTAFLYPGKGARYHHSFVFPTSHAHFLIIWQLRRLLRYRLELEQLRKHVGAVRHGLVASLATKRNYQQLKQVQLTITAPDVSRCGSEW